MCFPRLIHCILKIAAIASIAGGHTVFAAVLDDGTMPATSTRSMMISGKSAPTPFQLLARLDPMQREMLRNDLRSHHSGSTPAADEPEEAAENSEDTGESAAPATAAPVPNKQQTPRLSEEERKAIRKDVQNYGSSAKNKDKADKTPAAQNSSK